MDEKRTGEGLNMSALARAEDWARELESREAHRSGAALEIVRSAVSRKTGVPAGTLRSLRKRRLKEIGATWYERLREGVIRELEAEMRRCEFELQTLRQTGADPRSPEIAEVLASIATARKALGLSAGLTSDGGSDRG